MKTITLSNGQVVKIGLSYSDHGILPRRTFVWIDTDRGQIQMTALCSPKDKFSRARRRKVAALKLMQQIRETNPYPLICRKDDPILTEKTAWKAELGWVTPEDRRAMFLAICPEYVNNSKPGKKSRKCKQTN